MSTSQCQNCQNYFDQDKQKSKQLPCGCITCLNCLKNIYQFTKEIKCEKHQKVYSINPEELQYYGVQEQAMQYELQSQEKFVDQEKINEQLNLLNSQYAQKQNHYRMIIKEVQDSFQFFQHIQSLAIKAMINTLIDQFSISNDKIKNLLKRLSEFQVINEVYQQQTLRVGQQDPHLRQNGQGQLQQQFQQILQEISELKGDQSQWMDVQSLRSNVQQCMFGMFVYLSENSNFQLLTDREAEQLVQKYFEQIQMQNSLGQVSNSVVQQKIQLQSQNNEQQISQESQNIDYQQQNQIIDKQYGQDIVQVKQFLVQFMNQIKDQNVSIQSLKNNLLNKSGLINQVQILYQLLKTAEQQNCIKLCQIIQFCKSQQGVSQVSANALTILNQMNFVFSNQNFQNLDLTNSDLSDTTFTNCNFVNSNLTSANLHNTKFINCDFSNSNLTSIITEHPHILIGHTDSVTSISISSDSEFIASGSDDNTVRLWNIKTGISQTLRGHTSWVTSVAISSDSEFIVSGSNDKTVKLWEVKTGTFKTMSGHTNRVTSISISSDSDFIVSGSDDKTVRLWDVKTGMCKTMNSHTSSVYAVAISSDSEFIVSGSLDNTVRLWDVKKDNSQTLSGHTSTVTSVAISSDQEFIVSGSLDNTVRLWDVKTLVNLKVLSGHSSYVLSVIFSIDSKYIISGSGDKTIRVWSVQSGQFICTLQGHTDVVGSLSLSRDNN